MRPIQFLVLTILFLGLWVYLRYLRSRGRDRFIVLVVFCGGIVFVLMPNWSSRIAEQVGVGRGVDLVIYLSLLLLGFVILVLYSQLRAVRGQLTDLTRQFALQHARRPNSPSTDSTD